MSVLVWTPKLAWGQCHLGQEAATLVQPQQSHIVPKKQRLLECFIMENMLTATNIFRNDDDRDASIFTCNYHWRHEPQQIDHILSYDSSLRSRSFDSSATASDHWGLTATIASKRGRTKGGDKKPIGWECRDHFGFKNAVRALLNANCGHSAQEPRLSDSASFALYVFTDGSARDVSRKKGCSGVLLQ